MTLATDTNAVALAAGVVAVAAGAAFLLRQSLRRQLGAGVTVDGQVDAHSQTPPHVLAPPFSPPGSWRSLSFRTVFLTPPPAAKPSSWGSRMAKTVLSGALPSLPWRKAA